MSRAGTVSVLAKRAAAPDERMPVEELARRTAMTVRNLRALQAMGLLDPPELQGRKGFYGARHLARVRLVRKLQDRGFALGSIRELIAQWKTGGGLLELAGIEDALLTPVSAIGRSSGRVAEIFPTSCGASAITLEPNWIDPASTKAFALDANADWVAETLVRP